MVLEKGYKMLIIIFIYNIIKTYNFVLRNTHNVLSKDSGGDYKIDLIINEDDYEMIDKNQVKELSVSGKQFEDLYKLASIENNKSVLQKNYVRPYEDRPILTNANNYESFVTYRQPSPSKIIEPIKREMEYNYNNLIHEYYDASQQEAIWQNSSEIKEYYDVLNAFKSIFLSGGKTTYNNKSIGLQAITCLVNDYKNRQRPTKDMVAQLWRIIKIWVMMYLIVAVPLWCTRGWCCCCLFCKFFKPRKTIEEARKYLMINRPGVLKTKTRELNYDATEREKETYAEFEHFIKTL